MIIEGISVVYEVYILIPILLNSDFIKFIFRFIEFIFRYVPIYSNMCQYIPITAYSYSNN